jgi:hypothetical protein
MRLRPAGWLAILARILELNSNGLAHVVDDHLGDSYRRMS